jgi:hypothetical protein
MVQYAFIFDSFAITVEPFTVLDPRSGDENGARIQIRRVPVGAPDFSTHLAEPIWRGDLFKLTDGPPDNWDRAHYHPRFHGLEAGQRMLDPELARDPLAWALVQLGDLRGLATRAAAPDLVAVADGLQPQVDAVRDEIFVALQKCASAPSARPAAVAPRR